MPVVKIEAPEGVVFNVRKQGRVEKPTVITTQGYDEHGEPKMVQSFGPKATTWPDVEIVTFASEAREFNVDADNRIVVEVR